MNEHLPECIYEPEHFDTEQNIVWGWKPCICDALSACEQRVLKDLVPNLHLAEMQGHNRALTAAREAVETLDPLLDIEKHKGGYDCCGCDTPDKLLYDALAAIDALREKP